MSRWWGMFGSALVVTVAGLLAQGQQPFRAGVRTVPVYVSVTDGTGRFVLDLARDDFEVRDDGKVQPIAQFITDVQPLSVILMLDGSGSMLGNFNTVIEGANSFIIRMLPADRARIGSFADRVQINSPFTSDRDELLRFLTNEFNIRMGGETRLWDGVDRAVAAFGTAVGRRVVLVFSDGYDTSSTMTGGLVRGHAQQQDVMVYAVAVWTGQGPRETRPDAGLETLAKETGGGYFELRQTDEMNSIFTRIALELHSQYVLGFTPQTLDGKTHKIEVRVGKPGLKVQARKSYVATPAGGTPGAGGVGRGSEAPGALHR
jgi:Ca-activated chloride channel family protein